MSAAVPLPAITVRDGVTKIEYSVPLEPKEPKEKVFVAKV
jgi:hypothetical protein